MQNVVVLPIRCAQFHSPSFNPLAAAHFVELHNSLPPSRWTPRHAHEGRRARAKRGPRFQSVWNAQHRALNVIQARPSNLALRSSRMANGSPQSHWYRRLQPRPRLRKHHRLVLTCVRLSETPCLSHFSRMFRYQALVCTSIAQALHDCSTGGTRNGPRAPHSAATWGPDFGC